MSGDSVLVTGIRSYFLGTICLVWMVYTLIGGLLLILYSAAFISEKTGIQSDKAKKILPEERRVTLRRLACGAVKPSKKVHYDQFCPLIVIAIIWILEFIFIIGPITDIGDAASRLNGGELQRVFGGTGQPPNPFPTAFEGGPWMLPGGFSFFGPYPPPMNHKKVTFTYKAGCDPKCEIDVHAPDKNGTLGPLVSFILNLFPWLHSPSLLFF